MLKTKISRQTGHCLLTFHLLIYIAFMRRNQNGGRIHLEILTDLHVLSHPEYEEVVYLCMYILWSIDPLLSGNSVNRGRFE
jgi:hypothetical protein